MPSSVIVSLVYEVRKHDIYHDKYLGKISEKDGTNILLLLLKALGPQRAPFPEARKGSAKQRKAEGTPWENEM